MSTPKKYRKRPVVIEAMEWDGAAESASSVIEWVLVNGQSITYHCANDEECRLEVGGHVLRIPTLEGNMDASAGDFIIKGVNGEFYPCKPDIFAKTYAREDTAWPEAEA